MPDENVQSAEAPDQGQSEGTEGLYDLGDVTPEVREVLEPHLKAIEANATKKFQEAAKYRESWKPYEELGINEVDPEQLQQLLDFAQMTNDPEQFKSWVGQAAQELGLLEQGGGDEEDVDFGDDFEGMDPETIKDMVSQAVAENLTPVYEQLAQREQDDLQAQAYDDISSQLDQIEADNPNLPEGARDAIAKLAYPYADESDDPIAQGFEDYKALVSQNQSDLFKQKQGQGAPPEGPGAADTSPEPIRGFEDARAAGLARLKANANA